MSAVDAIGAEDRPTAEPQRSLTTKEREQYARDAAANLRRLRAESRIAQLMLGGNR